MIITTFFVSLACGSESGPGDGQSSDSKDVVISPDKLSGDSDSPDGTQNQDSDAAAPDSKGDVPASDMPSDSVDVSGDVWGDVTADVAKDVALDVNPPTDMPDTPDTAQDALADVPDPNQNLWLVSIDNGTHTLQRIDVSTGASTDLCVLDSTALYPSLTFSRSNRLFASRGGNSLDEINPCTCEVTEIGSYNGWSGVYGITSDQGFQLYGVATGQDASITINTSSGEGTLLGYLGVTYTSSGATWSDANNKLFAINSFNDTLCEIDPSTGISTELANLSLSFGTVGIELHPTNNTIYACTDDAHLRTINPITGEVTVIGDMNQTGSCSNLAAPWYDIPCINPGNVP
jgi:hypothetical protein